MTWELDYDAAIPPLPRPVEVTNPDGSTPSNAPWAALEKDVPAGCWAVRLHPRNSWSTEATPKPNAVSFAGTLRIEWIGHRLVASGDLYVAHPRTKNLEPAWRSPELHSEIPIFPREDYRFFLRLEKASISFQGEITLHFRLFRNDGFRRMRLRPKPDPFPINDDPYLFSYWQDEGIFTFHFNSRPILGQRNLVRGEVRNHFLTTVADAEFLWVSDLLRRIRLTIHRLDPIVLPGQAPPSNDLSAAESLSKTASTWSAFFSTIGYDAEIKIRPCPEIEGNKNKVWRIGQLQQELRAYLEDSPEDPDQVWGYHLFCVSRLEGKGLGYMFVTNDIEGLAARQACCIGANQNLGSKYIDRYSGCPLGRFPDHYLATAIHEVGHCLALQHNRVEGGLMQDPWRSQTAPGRFPPRESWEFSPGDRLRLRHAPDRWIRPGGYRNRWEFRDSIFDQWEEEKRGDLSLRIFVRGEVLVGAPLRADILLEGLQDSAIWPTLSLKSGQLCVWIRDPYGVNNPVDPLAIRLPRGVEPNEDMADDGTVLDSVVLLEGRYGSLLATAGSHQLGCSVAWDSESGPVQLRTEVDFNVRPPTGRSLFRRIDSPTSDDGPSQGNEIRLPESVAPNLSDRLLESAGITFAVAFRNPLEDSIEVLIDEAVGDSEYQGYFLMLQTRRCLDQLTDSKSSRELERFHMVLKYWLSCSSPPEFTWSEFLDVTSGMIELFSEDHHHEFLSRNELLEIVAKIEAGCLHIPVRRTVVEERVGILRSIAQNLST